MNKLLAQVTTGEKVDIGAQVEGFFGFKCITELIFRMVDVAIIGAGLLLLGFLIWGGLEWMMAGSDKGKIESARNKLVNAIIGVAVVAAAFAIWKVALEFFGIDISQVCTKTPFGST